MIKKIEYEITHFDFELINYVKKLRENFNLSQETLSIKMGLAKSFVGNVENIKEKHKYSTRHLTLLAKAFGYKKISAFLDFPTPQYDRIKVTVLQTYNAAETKVIRSEVVKIEEIN